MKVGIAVVILTCLALVTTANASSVTLSPTVDAYAESTDWTGFFDTEETLKANRLANGSETRSVLEFDIRSIGVGMEITSATLNLFAAGSSQTIGVQGFTGSGGLEANDFTVNNEILQFDPEPQNMLDVTTFIQDQYLSGSDFVGFQLRELDVASNNFASQENSNELIRPSLLITYRAPALPEPASLALLVLGVAGLSFARKVCS